MLLAASLFAVVLIPYLVLGSSFEESAAQVFREQTSPVILAGLGILLLAADVVLPIPSSVARPGVSMSLNSSGPRLT